MLSMTGMIFFVGFQIGTSISNNILTSVAFVFYSLFQTAPTCVFLLVYGEVIGNLYTWAYTLENDIRTNSMNEILTQTLMECKLLSIALTKPSNRRCLGTNCFS
jgi:hypothetical protein